VLCLKERNPVAFGYKGMKVPRHTVEGRQATVEFTEILARRPGTISEVYPFHGPRGQKMPCFECQIPFDSGMSGGPVMEISDAGPVIIGVISSDFSFDYSHGGSGEHALASVIWPSMIIPLEKEKLAGIANPTLLDFEQMGLIADRSKAHSHVRWNEQRTIIRWEP
jgi:hypothetical protein